MSNQEFRIATENGREMLTIQSSRIKECMEFFMNSTFEGIQVNLNSGFEENSLDFLNDYPDVWQKVKSISIAPEVKDLAALKHLTALEYIATAQKNPKIDYSFFPELAYLTIAGDGKIKKLESCKKLVSLTIYYYNPACKDFSGLPAVSWIKELHIINSTVLDMMGFERFNRLEKVSLYFLSKLKELGYMENCAKTLTWLEIDGCRNIYNSAYIGNLKRLKFLAYNNCEIMKSLDFIEGIKTLRDLQFIGTDVIDGNLNPLLKLDFVAFTNRRRYVHSFASIRELYGEKVFQHWVM